MLVQHFLLVELRQIGNTVSNLQKRQLTKVMSQVFYKIISLNKNKMKNKRTFFFKVSFQKRENRKKKKKEKKGKKRKQKERDIFENFGGDEMKEEEIIQERGDVFLFSSLRKLANFAKSRQVKKKTKKIFCRKGCDSDNYKLVFLCFCCAIFRMK